MSSFATFFRTLPETLQQPAALAMLGSVGAHLLLFATLPAFTSSTEPRPEAEVRRVRLLEPPQGSSAPQASTSRLGPPPVPNTPNSPNSKVQIPPVGQGTSPVPNPLYTIPDLTPIPIPAPPQTQISSQDRFNDLLRRLAARQQQPTTIKIPKPPAIQPAPAPTTPPNSNLKPADPAEVARASAPLPSIGTPQPAPTTPPTAPTSQAPSATTAEAQVKNNQLLAATRYSAEGTTQQDGIQAAQNLAQELNTKGVPWEYIRLRQPQEELKQLPYPLTFALNNYKQHPVAIAVFVGKDGKPLPDRKPQILNSTGYQILNDKAIEIVQKESSQPNKYPAIAEDKIRVYVYEFQFKAPNAGTASAPQQRS